MRLLNIVSGDTLLALNDVQVALNNIEEVLSAVPRAMQVGCLINKT